MPGLGAGPHTPECFLGHDGRDRFLRELGVGTSAEAAVTVGSEGEFCCVRGKGRAPGAELESHTEGVCLPWLLCSYNLLII